MILAPTSVIRVHDLNTYLFLGLAQCFPLLPNQFAGIPKRDCLEVPRRTTLKRELQIRRNHLLYSPLVLDLGGVGRIAFAAILLVSPSQSGAGPICGADLFWRVRCYPGLVGGLFGDCCFVGEVIVVLHFAISMYRERRVRGAYFFLGRTQCLELGPGTCHCC
jgi:hypothetical protein